MGRRRKLKKVRRIKVKRLASKSWWQRLKEQQIWFIALVVVLIVVVGITFSIVAGRQSIEPFQKMVSSTIEEAEAKKASGDLEGAVTVLERGIARAPLAPELRIELAKTLRAIGREAEAQEVVQQAMKDFPRSKAVARARRESEAARAAAAEDAKANQDHGATGSSAQGGIGQ